MIVGIPGVKTDVELNVIRQELAARFAIVARCVTVEIWAWIQEMTVRGYGQCLGHDRFVFAITTNTTNTRRTDLLQSNQMSSYHQTM